VEGSNFVSRGAAVKPLAKNVEVEEYVCVVDAFSTGACIAWEASKRGYGVVHVLSLAPSEELAGMVPAHLRGAIPWATTLNVDLSRPTEEAAKLLAAEATRFVEKKGGKLIAVICGAETGVKLADYLSANLATNKTILTNGTRHTEARRNKALMGDAVRAAGVRAVRQMTATSWEPVKEWLQYDWGLKCHDDEVCDLIVKPLESAGSDGVTACYKVSDVPKAIESLVGNRNGLGLLNEGVLVQEFLRGTEYVVDTVSRAGNHKVLALWEYDRRPTNGSGFVLHGQKLLSGSNAVVSQLVPYAEKVLDALELNNGPSHMEVKLTPTNGKVLDPCLVEVGARCHGAEGFWMSIADETCGRNQAVAALDSYVNPDSFKSLPKLPPHTLLKAGCVKYLLVHQAGTLLSLDSRGLDAIKALPSYRGHEIFLTVGKPVIPTANCFSWGGIVKLVNATDQGLQRDYDIIEQLCLKGLWTIV